MPKMTFARAVERLRELSDQDARTAWEMGDIALEMVPMGTEGVRNGAQEKVRVLAEAAGLSFDLLLIRRHVASAFPPVTRVTGVAWSVYRELLNVEPGERERLLTIIRTETPDTPSGRWTVSAVRVRMGLSSILHVSEPASDHVQRASTEERAAIFESLRIDPAVQRTVREQDAQLERDQKARVAHIESTPRPESPLTQVSARLQALTGDLDLAVVLHNLLTAVAKQLPQIAATPNPAEAYPSVARLLPDCQEALSRVERVLATGRMGEDTESFLRRALSESAREGGA